ncbi:MAG TPA: glycosyltransferase family A protein [Thermoleophilaceae bacterium]
MSVVITAWNAAATIGRTLAALGAQDLDEPYETIVVDNGSDDGTGNVVRAASGPVELLRREHGLAGEARNHAAAAARGDALAFTDADCFPDPGWLTAGLRALDGGADLVQGLVRPDPAAAMGPFDRSLFVSADDGLYQTANLFVRRALFERLGGFEEVFDDPGARAFGEDVWLGWRARRAGARAAFCPGAVVDHAVLPRGPGGYVRERRRLALFPGLVRRVPELRRSFLFGRVFLSRRTAAFDAAAAGLALAAARRSWPPALAAAPYARTIAARALQSGRRAPLVAPVEVAADAVGLLSLAEGSVRSGRLLL